MGNITGDLTLPQKTVSNIMRKELTLLGTWNSEYIPSAEDDDWRGALTLMKEGILPSQLVTHPITLDEVPETLRKLYLHKTGKQRFESIKVMVKVSE